MIAAIKLIFISLFTVILSATPFTAVNAQENLIFGQEHAYSVFVKSNKEAFVFARLVLTNPDESPLTKSSFKLSNAKASEMSVYQVILPQECAQYEYQSDSRTCVRYKEPSYTEAYNYSGSSYGQTEDIEYHKVTYQESDGNYSFDLPKAVEPYRSTALVVIYATKDYISSSMGRYTFTFETLAVAQRVTESNVAVTAETDFLMKNPDMSYRYYDIIDVAEGVSTADSAQESFTNPDIDQLVYSIGGRGQLNKTFKSITPNETASVRGMFADSWLKLYLFEAIFAVIGIVGFFILLIFLSKRYGRRVHQVAQSAQRGSTPSGQLTQDRYLLLVPSYWIASFVSALLVGGLTLILTAMSRTGTFNFLGNAASITNVFTILLGGFLYLLVIFGPAVFVGVRHRWKAAATVLVLQFVWYAVAVLLLTNLSK